MCKCKTPNAFHWDHPLFVPFIKDWRGKWADNSAKATATVNRRRKEGKDMGIDSVLSSIKPTWTNHDRRHFATPDAPRARSRRAV